MYDLVIKNGRVIDGTGSPSFFADVAVKDGKIACVGKGLCCDNIIDASGCVVTPGFIDAHSHADRDIMPNPEQTEKVEQGITTSIGGQCGDSPAPNKNMTMGEFLKEVKDIPQGSNIAVFVGHSNLRRLVMGIEDRDPTPDEMEKMKAYLREGLENGAIGLSFGLIYTPSCSSKTAELVELAKVVSEYGGVVEAHIRNESEFLSRSVNEMITIAKEADVRVVISHLKAAFSENWGKVGNALSMIEKANEDGFDVYCNAYPYTASSTSVGTRFLPIELRAEGGAVICEKLSDEAYRRELEAWNREKYGDGRLDWVLIISCPSHKEFEGKTVSGIADELNLSDYDAVFHILRTYGSASACFFSMCERDVEAALSHERAMICTDSGVAGNSTTYHPRVRGSFPRVLGRYVRERGVTTLHEMIRKMTGMPAAVYGLGSKGIIKEGLDADICIFDPEKIIDRADYVDPTKRAEGLNYVLVSGEIVVENAVHNGKKLGKVITANNR